MAERADLIVRNGTVVTAQSRFVADVAAADGRVVAIGAPGTLNVAAEEELDARGCFVLPGVIDCHVHFREPGLEYKEDWASGSRAAVMGGVTTVMDMPNTVPPTSTGARVEHKRALAESKSYCDFGLYGLLAPDNLDELLPMARAGVIGYKCFLGESTGNLAVPDDGVLLDAMRIVRSTGLRIGFHAESNQIMQHLIRKLKAEGRTDPLAHRDSRPPLAEVEAIQRVGLFARASGARVHIFHLSSRDGLEVVCDLRRQRLDVTCETAPHYCFLSSNDMRMLGAMLRINPPLREPGHADALLHGLIEGDINCIATDHSPHTVEEKRADSIWQAVSGFVGVETSVRLFLTCAVNRGLMTLEGYVRVASQGPARTWGLFPRKGTIAPGCDADFTIVDLDRRGVVESVRLHSRNNPTPFDGFATHGEVIATVLRGRVVMREGEIIGPPRGRMLSREES